MSADKYKVIICTPGNQYNTRFLRCLAELIVFFKSKGIAYAFSNAYSRDIYQSRNLCLKGKPSKGPDQKPFNGMNYSHVLWLDSDVSWKLSDIGKLFDADKDAISGLYYMADGKYFAAVEDWDEDYFREHGSFKFLDPDAVNQRQLPFIVSYAGLGFMLVKKEAMDKLQYPWFAPMYFKIEHCVDFCMEDVSFCKSLQNVGVNIFIHPDILVEHEKSVILK